MTKTIYATEYGSFIRHQPTGQWSSWDLLSAATREHERFDFFSSRTAVFENHRARVRALNAAQDAKSKSGWSAVY